MCPYLHSEGADQIQMNLKTIKYNYEIAHTCLTTWEYGGLIWRVSFGNKGKLYILIYIGDKKVQIFGSYNHKEGIKFHLYWTVLKKQALLPATTSKWILRSFLKAKMYTEGCLENTEGSKVKVLREKISNVLNTKKKWSLCNGLEIVADLVVIIICNL